MSFSKGFHEPVEKPRRFYKSVSIARADDGGHAVLLDGRRLRTPKSRPLALPTAALAALVAAEWDAQGETIELAGMHVTRLANTALELVPASREGMADQFVQYGGSDLICYFAEAPRELLARQEAGWGPLHERYAQEDGVALVRAAGIVHRPQPSGALDLLRAAALAQDDFRLTGLSFGAALYGSAFLSLAALRGWVSAEEAYELSRIDDAFQESKWGVDAEAAERTQRLREEARMLGRWFEALTG